MSIIVLQAPVEAPRPSIRLRPRISVRRDALWLLAAWAAFVPLGTLRIVLIHSARGQPAGWGSSFGIAVLNLAQFAAISFALLWVARRYPLSRGPSLRATAMNGGAAVVLSAVRTLADFGAVRVLPVGDPHENAALELGVGFLGMLLTIVTLQAGMHAIAYAGQLRARERESLRLEARLAQAELSALKMQLHPHFLFNALNTITSFVHSDPRRAGEMIGSLGELLRASLAHGHAQEVEMEEELAALEPYLEIERARFGPRLSLCVEAGPGTLRARVPHLLLQPLVENAVRHGIAPRGGPGTVRVRAERSGATLRVTVRDDGLGMGEGGREGVGLATTRARLRHLYGDAQRLALRPAEGGGTVATIEIPYREEAA